MAGLETTPGHGVSRASSGIVSSNSGQRPLLQRLGEVHTQVLTFERREEPILCAMREAITDFRRQAVVTELTT